MYLYHCAYCSCPHIKKSICYHTPYQKKNLHLKVLGHRFADKKISAWFHPIFAPCHFMRLFCRVQNFFQYSAQVYGSKQGHKFGSCCFFIAGSSKARRILLKCKLDHAIILPKTLLIVSQLSHSEILQTSPKKGFEIQ